MQIPEYQERVVATPTRRTQINIQEPDIIGDVSYLQKQSEKIVNTAGELSNIYLQMKKDRDNGIVDNFMNNYAVDSVKMLNKLKEEYKGANAEGIITAYTEWKDNYFSERLNVNENNKSQLYLENKEQIDLAKKGLMNRSDNEMISLSNYASAELEKYKQEQLQERVDILGDAIADANSVEEVQNIMNELNNVFDSHFYEQRKAQRDLTRAAKERISNFNSNTKTGKDLLDVEIARLDLNAFNAKTIEELEAVEAEIRSLVPSNDKRLYTTLKKTAGYREKLKTSSDVDNKDYKNKQESLYQRLLIISEDASSVEEFSSIKGTLREIYDLSDPEQEKTYYTHLKDITIKEKKLLSSLEKEKEEKEKQLEKESKERKKEEEEIQKYLRGADKQTLFIALDGAKTESDFEDIERAAYDVWNVDDPKQKEEFLTFMRDVEKSKSAYLKKKEEAEIKQNEETAKITSKALLDKFRKSDNAYGSLIQLDNEYKNMLLPDDFNTAEDELYKKFIDEQADKLSNDQVMGTNTYSVDWEKISTTINKWGLERTQKDIEKKASEKYTDKAREFKKQQDTINNNTIIGLHNAIQKKANANNTEDIDSANKSIENIILSVQPQNVSLQKEIETYQSVTREYRNFVDTKNNLNKGINPKTGREYTTSEYREANIKMNKAIDKYYEMAANESVKTAEILANIEANNYGSLSDIKMDNLSFISKKTILDSYISNLKFEEFKKKTEPQIGDIEKTIQNSYKSYFGSKNATGLLYQHYRNKIKDSILNRMINPENKVDMQFINYVTSKAFTDVFNEPEYKIIQEIESIDKSDYFAAPSKYKEEVVAKIDDSLFGSMFNEDEEKIIADLALQGNADALLFIIKEMVNGK